MKISYPGQTEYVPPRKGGGSDANLTGYAIAVIATFIVTAGGFLVYISNQPEPEIVKEVITRTVEVGIGDTANLNTNLSEDNGNTGGRGSGFVGSGSSDNNSSGTNSSTNQNTNANTSSPTETVPGSNGGTAGGGIDSNSGTDTGTDPGITNPGDTATEQGNDTETTTDTTNDTTTTNDGQTSTDSGTSGDQSGQGGGSDPSNPLCVIDANNIELLYHTNDCN